MVMVKAAWLGAAVMALAAAAPVVAAQIYSCVDANGKRLTSDRPIPACIDREQRLHNADGSVRKIVPRTLTPEERAEKEAREREAAAERLSKQDAVRRDRNLLARFPNEAAHGKAREAALDSLRRAMRDSEARLAELAKERKPLMSETEFYVGKQLPVRLKRQIDANDAATHAQRTSIAEQQTEMERINAIYDAELERLKLLWGGAPPGSAEPAPAPPQKSAQR